MWIVYAPQQFKRTECHCLVWIIMVHRSWISISKNNNSSPNTESMKHSNNSLKNFRNKLSPITWILSVHVFSNNCKSHFLIFSEIQLVLHPSSCFIQTHLTFSIYWYNLCNFECSFYAWVFWILYISIHFLLLQSY